MFIGWCGQAIRLYTRRVYYTKSEWEESNYRHSPKDHSSTVQFSFDSFKNFKHEIKTKKINQVKCNTYCAEGGTCRAQVTTTVSSSIRTTTTHGFRGGS